MFAPTQPFASSSWRPRLCFEHCPLPISTSPTTYLLYFNTSREYSMVGFCRYPPLQDWSVQLVYCDGACLDDSVNVASLRTRAESEMLEVEVDGSTHSTHAYAYTRTRTRPGI